MTYNRFTGITRRVSTATIAITFAVTSILSALVPIVLANHVNASTGETVVINEFSSRNPEWIEFYNPTDSDIDVTGWYVLDEKDTKKTLSGTVLARDFYVLDIASGYLNDPGDAISLYNSADEIVGETIRYGKVSEGTLDAPNKDQSAYRTTDAGSEWALGTPTRGVSNSPVQVTVAAPDPTPSTNDANREKGWAHVNEISKAHGSVTLEFVSTRNFYSCFEYRTDGDNSERTGDNYNKDISDGLFPFECITNETKQITLLAESYVDVRMVFGAEGDERFDWTRFNVGRDTAAPKSSNLRVQHIINGNTGKTLKLFVDLTDESGVNLSKKYTFARINYGGKEFTYGFSKVADTENTYVAVIDTTQIVPVNHFGTIGTFSLRFADIHNNGRSSKPDQLQKIGIDNSGPGASLVTPASGSSVRGNTTFTFKLSDHTETDHGYAKLVGLKEATSPLVHVEDDIWQASFDTTKLPDGTYRIDIRPTDVFGTARYGSNKGTAVIDNTKPTITVNVADGSYNPVQISVTANDNNQLKQVTGHVYNETNSALIKNCSLNVLNLAVQDYTLTCAVAAMNLADGTYTIRANAQDAAGRISATDSSVQFIIDTTAPEKVSGLTAYNGSNELISGVTRDKSVVYKWNSVVDAAKYEYCYWNDITTSKFREANCYTTYPTKPAQSGTYNQGEGTHFVKIRAIDAAGNKGEWSEPLAVYYLENEAALFGENFNTHNGGDYGGLNVGFRISHFGSVSNVTVELYANDQLLTTNTHNQDLIDLIAGGTEQLSTPFIIHLGTYKEEYWNLGLFKWTHLSPVPSHAVITVSGTNNAGEPVTEQISILGLAEPNGVTFADLLPKPTVTDENESGNNEEDEDVLGAQTQNQPSQPTQETPRSNVVALGSSESQNENTPGEVQSATDDAENSELAEPEAEPAELTVDNTDSSTTGFAWYWWPIIVAAAILLFAAFKNVRSYNKD